MLSADFGCAVGGTARDGCGRPACRATEGRRRGRPGDPPDAKAGPLTVRPGQRDLLPCTMMGSCLTSWPLALSVWVAAPQGMRTGLRPFSSISAASGLGVRVVTGSGPYFLCCLAVLMWIVRDTFCS